MTFHMSISGVVLAMILAVLLHKFSVDDLTPVSVLIITGAAVTLGIAFLGMFLGVQMIGAKRSSTL